ncbi:MAG: hypothetical protein WCW16_03130 [Candidatus Magasanikbacteria bacterium]
MVLLFFIGIIEMIVISTWTKMVSETKVVASGMVTMVNIIIWYYVLQTFVSDIANVNLLLVYAIGCALGTMLTVYAFRLKDGKKKEKIEPEPVVDSQVAVHVPSFE